ncbi:hypothetical protein SBI_08593 [Streptomyces bingchenggensis BCW-1]|uniref:Uncharacterized protein n=1 Tax=Streptomyces bingchenggensis (strain BCW-1) TaxID=749414 RepID=D7BUG2_STRBB|nr:hypothetical protein SBI_08593 [Streptomyces bingchenggensis BCW-1]
MTRATTAKDRQAVTRTGYDESHTSTCLSHVSLTGESERDIPVTAPSLQDGIDQAGSPVKLLWKPEPTPWTPEVIEPEYAG